MTALKSLLAFLPRSSTHSASLPKLLTKRQSDRDACRHELMATDDMPAAHFPDDLIGSHCRP